MKKTIVFAIIAVALLSVVIIAIAMNKSYQDEQSAKLQAEIEKI
jgi:hypothetical protein